MGNPKTYDPLEYGGSLYTTRYGRSRPRPVSTTDTMHLVLRSTRAVGAKSFRRPRNAQRIDALIRKFSARFDVGIVLSANNHNHLHFQIRLRRRVDYLRFIRALTAAIAMAVDGRSRWKRAKAKFWDRRPYTRIAKGRAAARRLFYYVLVNQVEADGYDRETARFILALSGMD